MFEQRNTQAAQGLMAFWTRIDGDYLLRFQQWHNCEHIPERVALPGFLVGRRYRDCGGEPYYLMYYETADTQCLSSAAYMAALNSPTDWTRESLAHFREPARNVYSLVRACGAAGSNAAPYLTTLRFNLEPAAASQDRMLIETEVLTKISGIAGISRSSFHEVDEATTNIATSERKIYGDGPGAQQFLLFIDGQVPQENWSVSLSQIWAEVFDGRDPRINLISDEFWLEFGYSAATPK